MFYSALAFAKWSTFTLILSLGSNAAHCQPADWYNLDPTNDGVLGVSADRAYKVLPTGRTLQPVIVAVIDDGVDIFHPDFEGRIWRNTEEIPDNGIDDDGNGYVDDVHGWNFLGNPNGECIEFENLELTRLLRPLQTRFADAEPKKIAKVDKKDFATYIALKSEYDAAMENLNQEFTQFAQIAALVKGAYGYMSNRLGKEEVSLADLAAFQPQDDEERQIVEFLLMAEQEGVRGYLEEAGKYFEESLSYHYNLDFEPRTLVNEADSKAKGIAYGNPMVWAANPDHGTHVAGIIGAVRGNGVGVDGIAANAIIMPIRAVPGGDERDEDVALAIRYAADNGARIINMSFGKALSPDKELVWDAIRYARSKDVLLVHAAGNDTKNIDKMPNYPDGSLGGKKGNFDHWIEVAASGPVNDLSLLADFSNFGPVRVDVMAPGVDILSLHPGGEVKVNSGTSMAAPVVSGVATVLRGLYPELSAPQIKRLIINSLYYPTNARTETDKGEVPLSKLIRYPGIVNLERAIQRAEAGK
jgi:subtilisin family serine protease